MSLSDYLLKELRPIAELPTLREWVAEVRSRPLCVAGADIVAAPDLIDYEVASAVRELALRGEIRAARGARALDDLAQTLIFRFAGTPLLRRIWEIRANVDAFDAAYVALAERLQLPLITTDRRLGRSRSHRAEIIAYSR